MTVINLEPISGEPKIAEEHSKGIYRLPLATAIKTLTEDKLRDIIHRHTLKNETLARNLCKELLVTGRDVVRYREVLETGYNEAEDDFGNGNGSGSEAETDEKVKEKKQKTVIVEKELDPISVSDNDVVARYTGCSSCLEEFDLSENSRYDCIFHPGRKDPDYGADTWDDHDENIHGRLSDLGDDPELADGYMWTCCERRGDDIGCRRGMHKARNQINCIVRVERVETGKRKADSIDEGQATKRIRALWE